MAKVRDTSTTTEVSAHTAKNWKIQCMYVLHAMYCTTASFTTTILNVNLGYFYNLQYNISDNWLCHQTSAKTLKKARRILIL